MKHLLFLFALTFAMHAFAGNQREESATVVLQVGDRPKALTQVLGMAELRGGYFLNWDEWNVALRIPSDQLKGYLKALDSVGYKVDQGYSTIDQTDAIANFKASILSRRKLLDSYFAMVQESNPGNLQVVERAIVDLVEQIELDEGRLRGMQSRTQFALVQVSFRFMDRTLPAPNGYSPYAWINSLDLVSHRGEF